MTAALGSTAAGPSEASVYTGAGAAALNSFAAGNIGAIGAFDWTHLIGLAAEASPSDIPGLSTFAEAIGGLAEQASSLAIESQQVCQ